MPLPRIRGGVDVEAGRRPEVVGLVLAGNIDVSGAGVGENDGQAELGRLLSKVGFGADIFVAACQA